MRCGAVLATLLFALQCPCQAMPGKTDVDMRVPPAAPKDPRFIPGQYSTMVILVPFGQMIEVDVDNFLRRMETKGATVWREQGRFIDHLRSAMAYAAIKAGFEELLWVDADTRPSL